MTDPISNEPTTPGLAVDEATTDEQVHEFSWWLCMLPFFAAIAFFIWRWFQFKADTSYLMYAAGALIIGLAFTGMIAGAGSSVDAERK